MPATPGGARTPTSNRMRTPRLPPGFSYEDVPGFRAAADLDAIRDHNHVLIPGQCVGSEPVEGDREPPDEKIARLTADLGG